MAPTREQLIEAATEAIKAYEKWDVDAIVATRSPTSIHQVVPRRLGHPPADRKQLRETMESFQRIFPNGVKFTSLRDPLVDVPNRRVALYYKIVADSLIGEYRNEYVFTVDVNADGTAIDHFEEFLDTEQFRDFERRVQALDS